ncbi:hypothetical protein C2E23DRAFT_808620 [Lenzites betulinus]|nr:hypothetical protein C2E23DRAFT_808620 [Lenzites betulinus]
MSTALRAPEQLYIPLSSLDIPRSPLPSPQWPPESPSFSPTPLPYAHPHPHPYPRPRLPPSISITMMKAIRLVRSELLVVLLLFTWSTFLSSILSYVISGFGLRFKVFVSGSKVRPTPQTDVSVLALEGNGILAALIGCTVVSLVIACVSRAIWVFTHIHDAQPVGITSRRTIPLSLLLSVTGAAVLASVFAPSLGVVLYAKHLLDPPGYTPLVALRVYMSGMGVLVGLIVAIGGIIYFMSVMLRSFGC